MDDIVELVEEPEPSVRLKRRIVVDDSEEETPMSSRIRSAKKRATVHVLDSSEPDNCSIDSMDDFIVNT
jgi:hypothetical protein